MGQNGQEDEADQEGRQVLPAVTEVVLEVVTLGFQSVIVFMLWTTSLWSGCGAASSMRTSI